MTDKTRLVSLRIDGARIQFTVAVRPLTFTCAPLITERAKINGNLSPTEKEEEGGRERERRSFSGTSFSWTDRVNDA